MSVFGVSTRIDTNTLNSSSKYLLLLAYCMLVVQVHTRYYLHRICEYLLELFEVFKVLNYLNYVINMSRILAITCIFE